MNHSFADVMSTYVPSFSSTYQLCISSSSNDQELTHVLLMIIFLPSLVSSQPKLLAGDLLDLVVSYFSLKEKEYFGLACADEK